MCTQDIYKDIAADVETSSYELDCYQKEKIKKVIGLMKDELGGIIMTKLFGLRAETWVA